MRRRALLSLTRRGLTARERKPADTCAAYLERHKPYLAYDAYLAGGLPIATGVIEGACRYLLRDRMEITGARWPGLQRAALRKLLVVDAAETIHDLRTPPGNRLEKLTGDRIGQYSIRINDRWRICFRWRDGDADDVEIADYHG